MSGTGFVKIIGLTKTFPTATGGITVLNGVDLEIPKGEIFGIIGFSGAGKSTLLRCINRLETPDSGRIWVGGTEITGLSRNCLNKARQKIGMIFQHFNLFDARTVAQNISYPLEIAGWKKAAIRHRVGELLTMVELEDKHDTYPAKLSGGQKQRVGIARALANNPDLLLSDEATSALDPQTTYSILRLLKDINRKLGVTVVVVTHELDVIRYACQSVAVIEAGQITEQGPARRILGNPQSQTARQFMQISQQFISDIAVEQGGFI